MIRENPLLGPEWAPLADAIALVLDQTGRNRTFCITTYGERFGLDPGTSPYFQGFKDEFGEFFIEAAANLSCEPPLTDEEFAMMDFLSWDRPVLDPDEYRYHDFRSESNNRPNFERRFSVEADHLDIAEFIMQTMVLVYGLTEEDFFNFGGQPTADKIEKLGKLGRLKWSDGNPDREIFAMPGKHLDLL
jgi:hypothetical protein